MGCVSLSNQVNMANPTNCVPIIQKTQTIRERTPWFRLTSRKCGVLYNNGVVSVHRTGAVFSDLLGWVVLVKGEGT